MQYKLAEFYDAKRIRSLALPSFSQNQKIQTRLKTKSTLPTQKSQSCLSDHKIVTAGENDTCTADFYFFIKEQYMVCQSPSQRQSLHRQSGAGLIEHLVYVLRSFC